MNKVICDVCGTSFPETAAQCPICGCAKVPTAQVVTAEETQPIGEEAVAYSPVKGGRYSKNNIRRGTSSNIESNSAATETIRVPERRRSNERTSQQEPQESNKGLIAVVIILLLAIVAVVVYIGVQVFMSDIGNPQDTTGATPSASTPSVSGPTGEVIPCTEIKLSSPMWEFNAANEQYLLTVRLTPENTTDKPHFVSTNPEVATVDQNGLIQPVGHGQTTVKVTCGSISVDCIIVCSFGETQPSVPPTQPGTVLPQGFVLKLITYRDSGEVTLSKEGEAHTLYRETNGVKPSDITWTTSDPAVVTVENGKIVGVNRGNAVVTATIGDLTATCKVHCSFDAAEPTPYTISKSDVTIGEGESFILNLKDSNGANVQNVEWTADKEGVVTIDEKGKITGGTVEELTKVVVSAEVDGFKYSCDVYVRAHE